jgi:hypothetical protein
MLSRPAWPSRWFPELSPFPTASSRTRRAPFIAAWLSRTPCLVEQRSGGPSRPTSAAETSSCAPSPCLCLSRHPAAERNFRDYSGHSVPLLLAEVRATPRCFQDPPFVLQASFTSFPSRFRVGFDGSFAGKSYRSPPRRTQALVPSPVGCHISALPWVSGNQPSPYTRA